MLKTPKVAGLLGAAVLVLGVTSACGGGSDDATEDGLTVVSVGLVPAFDVAPIYLGIRKGIFEKHGLKVDAELGSGGAALLPALLKGDYDFVYGNNTSILIAEAQGLDVAIVSGGSDAFDKFGAVAVPGDSPLETPSDLEGKTVGNNALRNINEVFIRNWVDGDGGDSSAVEFLEVGGADGPAAVSGHRVDAMWTAEPWLAAIVNDGGKVLGSPYTPEVLGDDGKFSFASYFAAQRTVEKDPETVEAFQEAIAEAMEYANENPDEARAATEDYMDLTQEVRDVLPQPVWRPEIDPADLMLNAELSVKYGVLESDGSLDDLVSGLLASAPTT
jgi:NitT/TauT family transport system substrate-binding protein